MIFLDTSYINSLIIKNDPYRQYAKNIQPLLEKEAKITNITVLIEVLNSISPYNFFGDVVELKDYLLNLHDFDFLTDEDYEEAFELFNHYNRSINFSDCTIWFPCKNMESHLFDADFDRIRGFERIHWEFFFYFKFFDEQKRSKIHNLYKYQQTYLFLIFILT